MRWSNFGEKKEKQKMKTLAKSMIIALIFFVGTTALIHVDRQNAQMYRQKAQIMETIENTIEKYASLR